MKKEFSNLKKSLIKDKKLNDSIINQKAKKEEVYFNPFLQNFSLK